jgi:TetR/AcrR family transcriptional repressor of nem operon
MNIGRPRKLEPDAILEIATGIFWTKGYEATSIADILKATGLHKGSLYQTFGDKKSLFIACLSCYQEQMLEKVSNTIKSAKNPIQGIRIALHEMIDETCTIGECSNRGCLAVNTLVETAPHDDDIRNVLEKNEHRVQKHMIETLTMAEKEFNHQLTFSPEITFGMIMTFMCGLNSVSKNMIDIEQSKQLLDTQLQMLGL